MAKISRHGGPSVFVGEQGPEPLGALADRLPPDAVVVDSAEVLATDEPESDAVDNVGEVLLAEVVPVGTIDEVIAWTEGDQTPPARLLAALDAERARPTSRTTLVAELERRLAQF